MCHDGLAHDPIVSNGETAERQFSVETDGAVMPVFAAEPTGDRRGRVVIVHDIYGANDFYHDLARRFAASGFSAYLPDLFVRQGALTEQSFDAARQRGALLSYPQAMKDISNLVSAEGEGSDWGTVGFCMGGTLVMHLATSERRLSAGVIYYGFPSNPAISANRPSEPMRETALIDMPLLGFWGDEDHGVGINNVEQYRTLLSAAGKDIEFHIYPGLPHGFLTFDGSSEAYQYSQESWQRTLEFFGERLGA